MSNLLNLTAIKDAVVVDTPYPYFIVERSIKNECVSQVIHDFPPISEGGSFNLQDVEVAGSFKQLIHSLDTPEFRELVGEKFHVDVTELPMMVTLRGISRKKDGRIHTDSKTKILTILIYLNEAWVHETGLLRVLNNGDDLNDYVQQVVPGPGTMIGFKVTDNCWHGYESFDGVRRSIQINFLTSEGASNKHRFFHGLSAKLKAFKRRLK
ncbi:MAG: 2OG-Fe(II) oxygenase [Pseudomonadota bacterium]